MDTVPVPSFGLRFLSLPFIVLFQLLFPLAFFLSPLILLTSSRWLTLLKPQNCIVRN